MIPQRFERQTYFYQKYTLPIKLRNLYIHHLSINYLYNYIYIIFYNTDYIYIQFCFLFMIVKNIEQYTIIEIQ